MTERLGLPPIGRRELVRLALLVAGLLVVMLVSRATLANADSDVRWMALVPCEFVEDIDGFLSVNQESGYGGTTCDRSEITNDVSSERSLEIIVKRRGEANPWPGFDFPNASRLRLYKGGEFCDGRIRAGFASMPWSARSQVIAYLETIEGEQCLPPHVR